MASNVAFSYFQTLTAPSNFVSRGLHISSHQNRSHRRAYPRCLPSPTTLMITDTSLNQNNSTAPHSVRDANTLIVGGGPTGLLTAILMARRNVPVTVLEQDDNLSRFDPLRAYTVTINHRGLKALSQYPSLMKDVTERGQAFQIMRHTRFNADGTSQPLSFGTGSQIPNARVLHSRISLVEVLQEYASSFENITLLKQTKVTNVSYDDSGEMTVYVSSSEKEYHIRTKLLLACDGKNSIVGKTLRETATDNSDVLQSSYGLGEDSLPTPSTGKLVKSIALGKEFESNELNNGSDLPDGTVIVNHISAKQGVSSSSAFWFTLFPMNSEMTVRCGGRIATTVQPARNELWSLKTAEEGYELFDKVLPQVKARSYISPENMTKFVEAEPLRLPDSTRVESLVVRVGGATQAGGVVFLGDAAHSFPPDLGQGLNAAWEGVEVLMKVLDALKPDSTIREFVGRYETEREKDVRALLEIVRRSAGFLAQRLPWSKVALLVVSSRLRSVLSRRLPMWFSPSLVELISRECSYSEAIRLYDETTQRLWVFGISTIVVPVLGVVTVLWR
eukprot:TRINITY_DN1284_c0_g1_i6.p1 TRINITY_DN1284_c0_g1~~TRINITY_DN1284_c0_g1_i6.p1  ORF type:complete len:560 (-),score=52.73 TRINITY_DN1284_c0_g1_i6:493-2172(-)